jgi:protein O-GlcNAc transferase
MTPVAAPAPFAKTIEDALALHAAGRSAEAMTLFERIRAAVPKDLDVLLCIATIALQIGQTEHCIRYARDGIKRRRENADFHMVLGNAEIQRGNIDAAIRSLRRALQLRPQFAEAHASLGCALARQDQIGDAIRHLNKALEISPKLAAAHLNKGSALFSLGLISEAIVSLQTAVTYDPKLETAYISLVKCLNFLPGATSALIAEASRRWGQLLFRPTRKLVFPNPRSPDRKLRLGYVSADLRTHSVAHFLESVLAAHDRSAFEITCYSNNLFDDATTERIKAMVDHWRPIRSLEDREAEAQIRADAIDILVDLSGHTTGERMKLFALKPTPIQCTWLGYYATTGLTEMDYIIADRFIVPPGDERHYTETPWRMPDSYLCFTPPEIAPPANELPARRNGYVTFGSCNNLLKVNNTVIALWSRLLRALPTARLLLRGNALSSAMGRDELTRKFAENGIATDRLILRAGSLRDEFIRTYHDFDIALDPFPYGGGTTTAEALWMGLPVVSLRGDRFSGRVSESILTTIGQPHLVVESEQAYLDTALGLAGDLDRLAELRTTLRSMVANSPLCDAPRFTRNLETAFRSMWHRWCDIKETAA